MSSDWLCSQPGCGLLHSEHGHPKIASFSGRFRFLSNFYIHPIVFENVIYPSVEHAFHAAKTLDLAERELIRSARTPGQAKKMGGPKGVITLRPDWDSIRLRVMYDLVEQKFEVNPLRDLLKATRGCELIEGNTWHDCFWELAFAPRARRPQNTTTSDSRSCGSETKTETRMCLETIQATGLNERGFGYKVFDIRNGKLYSPSINTREVRDVGRWLRASGWWEPRWWRGNRGWYVFTTLEGAQGYRALSTHAIFKVEYKHAHARGGYTSWDLRSFRPAVVASSIKILERVS